MHNVYFLSLQIISVCQIKIFLFLIIIYDFKIKYVCPSQISCFKKFTSNPY